KMRAAIDWSYDLLEEPHREGLARLSVFRGGFFLEGAEAVCGAPALAIVRELRERSLLQSADAGGRMRFRMLESIRAYAAEKLVDVAAVRAAHGQHFLRQAEALARELETAG